MTLFLAVAPYLIIGGCAFLVVAVMVVGGVAILNDSVTGDVGWL